MYHQQLYHIVYVRCIIVLVTTYGLYLPCGHSGIWDARMGHQALYPFSYSFPFFFPLNNRNQKRQQQAEDNKKQRQRSTRVEAKKLEKQKRGKKGREGGKGRGEEECQCKLIGRVAKEYSVQWIRHILESQKRTFLVSSIISQESLSLFREYKHVP